MGIFRKKIEKKDQKTKKIRDVRFSIRIKFGIFVIILMSFVTFVISSAILREETSILENQLKSTMNKLIDTIIIQLNPDYFYVVPESVKKYDKMVNLALFNSQKKELEKIKKEISKLTSPLLSLKKKLSSLNMEYRKAKWKYQKNKIKDKIKDVKKQIYRKKMSISRYYDEKLKRLQEKYKIYAKINNYKKIFLGENYRKFIEIKKTKAEEKIEEKRKIENAVLKANKENIFNTINNISRQDNKILHIMVADNTGAYWVHSSKKLNRKKSRGGVIGMVDKDFKYDFMNSLPRFNLPKPSYWKGANEKHGAYYYNVIRPIYNNTEKRDILNKRLEEAKKLYDDPFIKEKYGYYIKYPLYKKKKIPKQYREFTEPELYFKDIFDRIHSGALRLNFKEAGIYQKLVDSKHKIIDITLAILLRAIFFAFFSVGFMIKSIHKLAAGAYEVGKGNLDKRIIIKGSDELGQLSDIFNQMTIRVKRAQKEKIEQERMKEELKVAQAIQLSLLPSELPTIDGYKFGSYYTAMTEAGGDYYDFLDIGNKDYVGIVVADVSGHGVGGGLVMTMTKTLLKVKCRGQGSAAKVLTEMNPTLFEETMSNMFVTMFYGVLNYKTGELNYASSGHDPGIIYRKKEKGIELLKTEGLPLGNVDNSIYTMILKGFKVKLEPGDVLVQYTDGIIEAMDINRNEFGEERFYKLIEQFGDLEPEELINKVIAAVNRFTGHIPANDDRTIIAVKRL